MKYGYARVSTDGQSVEAQTRQLAKAGCERELIRARTAEGRERARARGQHMGRPPKLTAHQQREAIKRRTHGEPIRDIARTYNVSHSTISRLAS